MYIYQVVLFCLDRSTSCDRSQDFMIDHHLVYTLKTKSPSLSFLVCKSSDIVLMVLLEAHSWLILLIMLSMMVCLLPASLREEIARVYYIKER